MMKRLLQFLFPLLGLAILGYVLNVAISTEGFEQYFSATGDHLVYHLVRLAGLIAFTLVAFQVVTGPYMPFWEKLYGSNFYRYHGYQGVFALAFAGLHWLLISAYLKMTDTGFIEFHQFNYPLPDFIEFYLGPLALVIMACTVITAAVAILWNKPYFQRIWRVLHYANYAVFIFVYLHSRKVGTDVGGPDSPLKLLWDVFLVLMIVGFLYRRFFRPSPVVETSEN